VAFEVKNGSAFEVERSSRSERAQRQTEQRDRCSQA
jgi:hypothetical protein